MWFKKKVKIEEFVAGLVQDKIPKAIAFFDKENERSHVALQLDHGKLREIGAGMILFFIGKHYPDTEQKNLLIMSRAYKQVERALPALEANPKEAYAWWKAYTDGLIFQEDEARLKIACRITWEKLIKNKPFREGPPLKTFGYFLEMEVEGISKVNIC